MYNTIPELLRKSSVEHLFSTDTVKNNWTVWQKGIQEVLGANPSENEIINIGDNLSNIFRSTGNAGRTQGELSASGTAWESLVCWYINLCCVGSRIVAIRKMSNVPKAIQDAITVNYGNFACNTESDITVIIFPKEYEYVTDSSALNSQTVDGSVVHPTIKGKVNPKYLNLLAAKDFHMYELGIVQCKTNWNDNAQVPMLWDMIYSAGGFRGRNITIGKNGFTIQCAKNFTYAFATVPSNVKDTYDMSHLKIKRVANLSGGNYWGKPTVEGVARSLKEIFTNNYLSGFTTSIRTDIRSALPFLQNGDSLSYFRIFN